ncbi:MAG: DUF3108 domain-containing protein [Nibricoccus sp.]
MKRFIKLLRMSLILTGGSACAASFSAFGDGEELVYKVGWGVLGGAGEVKITAHAGKSDKGVPLMRIVMVTNSKGIVNGVYKYESTAEVLLEQNTGRLLSAKENGVKRSEPIESHTDFDYAAHQAHHRDVHRPERNRDIALPANVTPVDLISTLVATRNWKLKPGDTRDVVVFAGRDLFPVTVHAEGKEAVKTPLGNFESLVLSPRMEKEEPRGIFKRDNPIKVWIAQRAPFLPVQMQLQLSIGTATLTLKEYHPPKTPPAVASDS